MVHAPDAPVPVCFFLRSAGSPIYVHVADESGHLIRNVVMEPRGDGLWETRLLLKPGRYRYRFYVHEGQVTVCCPPEGTPRGQLDGMLHVRPPHESPACAEGDVIGTIRAGCRPECPLQRSSRLAVGVQCSDRCGKRFSSRRRLNGVN